jgi:glycosyltransferase involved in cell wall biosynthesis
MGYDGGEVGDAGAASPALAGLRGSGQPLTVLSVAFSLATVAPDAVGGAEQVLRCIDEALTRAGGRSVVVAGEGSRIAGTLVPVPRHEGAATGAEWHDAHEHHRRAIRRALGEFPVDLIHMHGLDFASYLPADPVPVLVTLHLPPSCYRPEVFHLPRSGLQLQCVSRAQRRACPSSPLLGPVIENGVPIPSFESGRRRREYAVALGRICPEKGFHLALDAARKAGCPLRLAGKVYRYEDHRAYFEDEIVPRLDLERCFEGPVAPAAKARLLAGARCLLVPSLVAETSSLVAMEALAAGTPVVAFKAGALTDIVEDGVTGFLVDDVDAMADAIGRVDRLDPETCRRTARRRFSAERMTARYLQRYRELTGR